MPLSAAALPSLSCSRSIHAAWQEIIARPPRSTSNKSVVLMRAFLRRSLYRARPLTPFIMPPLRGALWLLFFFFCIILQEESPRLSLPG